MHRICTVLIVSRIGGIFFYGGGGLFRFLLSIYKLKIKLRL